jgi:hypothetical protein
MGSWPQTIIIRAIKKLRLMIVANNTRMAGFSFVKVSKGVEGGKDVAFG